MRANNSAVYPSRDISGSNDSRRSSLAIDVSKRIRLFTTTNTLDSDYGDSDRNKIRRTTVANIPTDSPYPPRTYDDIPQRDPHQNITELKDFQYYQESPFRKNNGRARSGASDEIFLEDVQDEVSLNF